MAPTPFRERISKLNRDPENKAALMRPPYWRPPVRRLHFYKSQILSDALERAAELLGCSLTPSRTSRSFKSGGRRAILSHCPTQWASGMAQ